MRMEGGVKCLSSQNTSGVSGVNFLAAESNTIEVNGDRDFRRNKTTEKKQHASTLHKCLLTSSYVVHSRNLRHTIV